MQTTTVKNVVRLYRRYHGDTVQPSTWGIMLFLDVRSVVCLFSIISVEPVLFDHRSFQII